MDSNKLDFLKRVWIGKKVISMTNDYQVDKNDNCLDIGIVKDFDKHLPIVEFPSKEEQLCFSTIIEYSDEIWAILQKLTAEERYTLTIAI
jgi:hypothetical protein